MRRLDRWLLDVLFPTGVQCLLCGKASRGGVLCRACARELEEGRLHDSAGECRAAWRHTGAAAGLVHQLKYQGLEAAAQLLAAGMAEAAGTLPPSGVVTWVPASKRRLRVRGVDHGRLLAQAFSRQTGLPCRAMLRRTGERHTQQGLRREQRLKNAAGAFAALDTAPDMVILVDDVFTTGATARECMRVLRGRGAREVLTVTATRAMEIGRTDGTYDEETVADPGAGNAAGGVGPGR